jgi:hypothetical protein
MNKSFKNEKNIGKANLMNLNLDLEVVCCSKNRLMSTKKFIDKLS